MLPVTTIEGICADCNQAKSLCVSSNHKKCWNCYEKEFSCKTCGLYISPEHGGVVCSKCNSFMCCEAECVAKHPQYMKQEGQSITIDGCLHCLSIWGIDA